MLGKEGSGVIYRWAAGVAAPLHLLEALGVPPPATFLFPAQVSDSRATHKPQNMEGVSQEGLTYSNSNLWGQKESGVPVCLGGASRMVWGSELFCFWGWCLPGKKGDFQGRCKPELPRPQKCGASVMGRKQGLGFQRTSRDGSARPGPCV